MMAKAMEKIHREQMRKDGVPVVAIGDTVKIMVRIKEGDKERVQGYAGIVVARKGGGATETITVRKNSHGVNVERVFPLHSPLLAKIEVESSGQVRRAKLYYLRRRVGKRAKVEERTEGV